jgi:signal transduction histidine kinase
VTDDGRKGGSISELLALVVHDLRNPVATISANLSFVREVGGTAGDDPDVAEALADVDLATADLMRGLDHLSWIGRWMGGERALEGPPGDVRAAIESALKKLPGTITKELGDVALDVPVAGVPLARLIELLVRNSLAHADASTVRVRARSGEGAVIVEIEDAGRAIAPELRASAFTIDGQQAIKSRLDGRYSRSVGLLAARALADAIGARLEADGADGAAIFRLTFSR